METTRPDQVPVKVILCTTSRWDFWGSAVKMFKNEWHDSTLWKDVTLPSYLYTMRYLLLLRQACDIQIPTFSWYNSYKESLILSTTLILQLRKRYRLLSNCCEFPPKKIRNSTPKVLETRRVALEQYLQQIVKQCQRSSKPLPPPLLDFLQVSIHVPKISTSASSSGGSGGCNITGGVSFDSLSSSLASSTHKPLFGFVCKEPFLFESSQASLNVSLTGLPDIVTTATLQYFYT